MPLTVLTRGNANPRPGLSAAESRQAEAAWDAGHDRVAALSSRGANTVVPSSGHCIQLDRPGAVIEAIRTMVALVRRR